METGMPPITLELARYALSDAAALPDAVMAQAHRAFLNYIGCALGGSNEAATLTAMALADEFSGPRRASVIGHATRLDAQGAALVNCLASSIHTFDDTHLLSVTHPTGPVVAAMMGLLEHRTDIALGGAEFLAALALGIEISCRVARTLTVAPAHAPLGMFTTGIACGIGAAAACARLLNLSEQRTAWAIGIAAAQGGGFRATHSTMSGGLVPALCARNALAGALLASKDFDCSDVALEGKNGFFEIFSPGADVASTVRDLGLHFELLALSYKPYPCGVVIHPAIDASLALFPSVKGLRIASVTLQVHPLALQLTGVRHPANGFSSKNSLYHWTAAALLRGRAGLAEASDAAVANADIAALRTRIEATPEEGWARDEVKMKLRLADDRILDMHVPHARGGPEHPLSDTDLATKFMDMARLRLPAAQASELLTLCQAVPSLPAGWLPELAALCRV